MEPHEVTHEYEPVAHDYEPPRLDIDVLVHTHCHQKSLFGNRGDTAMLERAGARTTWLDGGCCGMAGSFGFNPNHARLSRDVAELALAPEVRKQPAGTVILTNGFSCREQVKHVTGRTAMHLAQVLAMGLPRRVAAMEGSQQGESASPSTTENVV